MKIKSLLYELRLEKGWTEADLARASGVTKSTINRIENNQASPTLITMVKLSLALGCKVDDLFYFE